MSSELSSILKNLSKKDSRSIAILVKRYCEKNNLNVDNYIKQTTPRSAELLLSKLPDDLIREIYRLL